MYKILLQYVKELLGHQKIPERNLRYKVAEMGKKLNTLVGGSGVVDRYDQLIKENSLTCLVVEIISQKERRLSNQAVLQLEREFSSQSQAVKDYLYQQVKQDFADRMDQKDQEI